MDKEIEIGEANKGNSSSEGKEAESSSEVTDGATSEKTNDPEKVTEEKNCPTSSSNEKSDSEITQKDSTEVDKICEPEKIAESDDKAKENDVPLAEEVTEPEKKLTEEIESDSGREIIKNVEEGLRKETNTLEEPSNKEIVGVTAEEEISKLPNNDEPQLEERTEEESSKKTDDAEKEKEPEPSCEGGENPTKFAESENLLESNEPLESEGKKSDDGKSDSECMSLDTDSLSKDLTAEKQCIEPENTEFVQISQDKQEDGPNEGQNIDAEDPFGGDNLTGDNVDSPPATDDMNFHKLTDQAVNLEDIVNAKGQTREFVTEDSNPDDLLEVNRAPETDSIELNAELVACESSEQGVDVQASKEGEEEEEVSSGTKKSVDRQEKDKEENISDRMIVESSNDADGNGDEDDGKKKGTEAMETETEESQSNVLPGQDDELCIIPDSMKETRVETDKSSKKDGKTVSEVREVQEQGKEKEKEAQSKELEIISNPEEVTMETEASSEDKEKKDDKAAREKKSSSTADVIDIEDDGKNLEIDEMSNAETCKQCNEKKSCNLMVKVGAETFRVCSQQCKEAFTGENDKSMDIPSDAVNSKREKRCASCLLIVEPGDERSLSWETMEFCNEECLGKFQMKYGSYCRNCNGSVQAISLGKYCVRFGYDVRQFCCSSCLEEFKKGLKVCSYCQKDISSGTEGFLAPVGDKGLFKDFCTQYCMEKYSRMNSTEPPPVERKSCSVCQEEKVVHCEVQIDRAQPVAICSDPCFAAFKFVNKVDPEQCSTCKKFFELANKKSFVVFYEGGAHTFCSKTCLNIFIITNRKIVPCNWCKVKKYNFDMIRKDLKTGQALSMCSLNCLTLYQVSVNAVSAKRISCDFCKEYSQAQYHLTMSDATIRNFCSYNCVMKFQGQYTKSPITIPAGDDPVPTGMPKRTYQPIKAPIQAAPKISEIASKKAMPVISSVTSLASLNSNGQVTQTSQQQQQQQPSNTMNNVSVAASVVTSQSQTPQVIVNQQVITRPPSPVKIHNKMTQCKPLTHTKGVSVRPHPCAKSTQTENEARVFIPVPVPIYVPFPVHMWSMPFPVPVPFPLPIPVPVFVPTTRNSAKGIFKDIKRIQEKIPADPFEAELLMMAEMVATDKKANESDSDSSDDNGREPAEPVDSSNTFGEDMLQMALKMATGELDEPAVDLETALTPNTITATQTSQSDSAINADVQPERNATASSNRGKKRMVPYKPRGAPSKRGRRISGVHDTPMMPPPESQTQTQPRMMEPIEKPDANMALKYTFGVNAWRQWVIAKNAELEKQITPTRKVKLFKTDLLQLTADELNYTLCLFVKEVRKPNGAEYAPDTIYYLCLGIQQYLFENNRIDNIFTDSYYEKFTDCLNDVAKKFSVLYNDAQYIVTRVEEEHLWECKQLGAHSPHVLLSTLMFFNTKHFNLVTVEEHMQLSFSHIMKHWKRNPAAQATGAPLPGKAPGTRNVLLRFYPPQSALEANSRKKKVYEQQENEENPLRCPVKLYEFYLSKCPESVKTRNDVFYLLPERSCVPDSPVWYSTSALAKEHLVKMLYRVKMVKEINVALLTS